MRGAACHIFPIEINFRAARQDLEATNKGADIDVFILFPMEFIFKNADALRILIDLQG